jgi:hypothetical protein
VEVELRTSCFPGRHSTSSSFLLQLLLAQGLTFMPGLVWMAVLLLHSLCNWDDRNEAPCPAILHWARLGLSNILPGLSSNHDSPALHLLSNQDYRHELLLLSHVIIIFIIFSGTKV